FISGLRVRMAASRTQLFTQIQFAQHNPPMELLLPLIVQAIGFGASVSTITAFKRMERQP
ncbi:hypothetical protein J5I95_01645, partial [Candidatus Poribacteria bacterium]|nr:hypothetical protein [Candidatus Poribacteria bacterium]